MASIFDCAVYCPVLLWIVSSRLLCLARCLCLCVVCWVLSLRLTRLFMVLGLENFCASLFGGEGGSLERVSLFFAVLVTDSWASGVARLRSCAQVRTLLSYDRFVHPGVFGRQPSGVDLTLDVHAMVGVVLALHSFRSKERACAETYSAAV